jgi:hypothetical protein
MDLVSVRLVVGQEDVKPSLARGRRIRGVTSHEIAVTGAWT